MLDSSRHIGEVKSIKSFVYGTYIPIRIYKKLILDNQSKLNI
jgi:hypothetical protein